MNCAHCQRQLLEENSGPEVEAHLADCLACGQWHKMLRQIESHVPLLPVPDSPRKLQLQEELIHEPVPAAATIPLRPPSPRPFIRIPWRQLAVAAGGLAAAAVLIACGIFLGNMLSPPPNQPW